MLLSMGSSSECDLFWLEKLCNPLMCRNMYELSTQYEFDSAS